MLRTRCPAPAPTLLVAAAAIAPQPAWLARRLVAEAASRGFRVPTSSLQILALWWAARVTGPKANMPSQAAIFRRQPVTPPPRWVIIHPPTALGPLRWAFR